MLKSFKKSILHITLAFLLAAACFVPLRTTNIAVRSTAEENEPLTELYYISDTMENYDSIQTMAEAVSLTYNAIPLRVETLGYEMAFWWIEEQEGVNWNDISNAYVIFELLREFPMTVIPESGETFVITDELAAIFEALKAHNCRIMFVCGTDEGRFYNHTEFLDYVDIHVNLDVFYMFYSTIFEMAKNVEEHDNELRETTFIFDFYFSGKTGGFVDSWFFKKIFLPYIRSEFRDEAEDGASLYEILESNGIQVLCYMYESEDECYFYDIVDGVELGEDGYEMIRYDYVYAVGATLWDETGFDSWLRTVSNYRERKCGSDIEKREKFKIFVFGTSGNEYYEFDEIYFAYGGGGYSTSRNAFICGERDLSRFDNYDGRCVVSHRPVDYTEHLGGWIPLEVVIYKDAWQLIMEEAEYNFFFNYSEEWLYREY